MASTPRSPRITGGDVVENVTAHEGATACRRRRTARSTLLRGRTSLARQGTGVRTSLIGAILGDEEALGLFPTLLVDLLSVLPLLIGSVFVVVTDRIELRTNFIPQWSFEPTNYWPDITKDWNSIAAFGLYALDVLFSFGWVVYHLARRHHPKHHASRANMISIIAHIIGGTTAIFGILGGLLSGSKWPILAACVGSLFFHSPTIWWQQRNVYGQRDLTLPCYTFLGWLMPVAILNVIWEDASFRTVFTAGMALNIFAMLRVLYMVMQTLEMSPKQQYERATLFAGFIHGPWIMGGPLGILIFVCFILLWNCIFDILQPYPRALLSHNFQPLTLADMQTVKGESIADVFRRMQEEIPGEPEKQAARAVYETIRSGDYVTLEDLQRCFMSWGMVGGMKFAAECFEAADEKKRGYLTAENFEDYFEFIYVPVLHYGPIHNN